MDSGKADLTAIDVSASPSVFYCPYKPIFTWILDETTTFYTTIITTCVACPITVLLNILVVVSVKKRRGLQTNANILMASMAVADFLVGAISMPLSISLDVLLLRQDLNHIICEIAFANQLVLYGAVCSSLYHITVIAWERYVAVKKWNRYKVIVTRARIKKTTIIAWLLAVITTTPGRIMEVSGVVYKYVEVLNIIFSFPAVVCLVLIGYFYIMAYLGIRNRKVTDDTSQSTNRRNKAKLENSIAKATGIITVVLLVLYIPSIVVLLFGEAFPFLRTSSFFRWSELLIQLNSLVNPILYCFALNRNFRKEVLEMMKIRKLDAVHPVTICNLTAVERRDRRIGATEFLEEVHEFHEEEEQPDQISRAGSVTTEGGQSQSGDSSDESLPNYNTQMKRPMRPSSCQVIRVDVHQPNPSKTNTGTLVTGATYEGHNETEHIGDENLSNYNTRMKRPIRPSSSKVIRVDVH